ncbi:MAG: hypothetical protein ACTSW4_01745 [Candidatus Ranarchaeia archaeon]
MDKRGRKQSRIPKEWREERRRLLREKWEERRERAHLQYKQWREQMSNKRKRLDEYRKKKWTSKEIDHSLLKEAAYGDI